MPTWDEWKNIWKQFEEERQEHLLNDVTWETVNLPKEEWYVCRACGGSKTYFELEDCHRSAGWVPCYLCNSDGMMTTKIVKVVTPKKMPYYG